MAVIITCSAPSGAEAGSWFNVSGIVYDDVTGFPYVGQAVNIYYNGSSLGSASTGIDGDYLATVKINAAGTYNIRAKCLSVYSQMTPITISEPPPPPPPPPPEGYRVTVYLDPPLNGVTLELRDRSYERDNLVRTTMTSYGTAYFDQGGLPDYYVYQVRFPPQGPYTEARTSKFSFQSNWEYDLELSTSTTITISALAQAMENQPFYVSGILYRNDGGLPIQGANIVLSCDGSVLGSAITGIDGDYLFQVTLATPGAYVLMASYGGTSASLTVFALGL